MDFNWRETFDHAEEGDRLTELTSDEMYKIMLKRVGEAPVDTEIAYIVYDFKEGKARKLKNKGMAQGYVKAINLQPGLYLLVTEAEWQIAQEEIANVEVEVPKILKLKEL